MKRIVYLDNASTTPTSKDVLKEMLPFFNSIYANPSSLHSGGVKASSVLEATRKKIANILKAQPDTIYFNSGGTEGNNLAIFGTAEAFSGTKGHIITVETEHVSVLEPITKLKNNGWHVTVLKTDKNGMINLKELIGSISEKTVLVSVMYVNNEIGSIQNIQEIGRAILKYRKENNSKYPYFHSDACQAAGYLPLDVEKLHVDLMTLNGGKINGPKGVGILYIRRETRVSPQILGGGQENGLRSGTENIPAIVGFGKALELCQKKRNKEAKRIKKLSEYFLNKIVKIFPNVSLNGPQMDDQRIPNNVNLMFPGIDGEKLVIYLDSLGVQCSTASACSVLNNEPSHVLKSIGRNSEENMSSVRFSLGSHTTKKDIEYAVKALRTAIELIK